MVWDQDFFFDFYFKFNVNCVLVFGLYFKFNVNVNCEKGLQIYKTVLNSDSTAKSLLIFGHYIILKFLDFSPIFAPTIFPCKDFKLLTKSQVAHFKNHCSKIFVKFHTHNFVYFLLLLQSGLWSQKI